MSWKPASPVSAALLNILSAVFISFTRVKWVLYQGGCFLGSGFIKTGQDGLEFQTLHILVSLRGIQVLNPGVLIIKFHRTVRTDGRQLPAHLSHVIMLLQSLLSPGGLISSRWA